MKPSLTPYLNELLTLPTTMVSQSFGAFNANAIAKARKSKPLKRANKPNQNKYWPSGKRK